MQYISIREVADRVLMHPKLQGVTLEKVIIYATQLMRLLRVPPAFQDVIAEINIDKHRGVLPEDFFMINQVRYKHSKLVLKAASDTFHLADEEKEHYVYPCYNIQGKWIITSSLDRPIEISYKSIPVDCDGYPLIPDNEAFIKALEAYIKEREFMYLFDEGKLRRDILEEAQREYTWYVGQAHTSMLMPSIDEMAVITNMWNQLIPRMREYANQFKTLGLKEIRTKW